MIDKISLPPHLEERLGWFLETLEIKEGMICGGALRRLFAREEPRDIDVFVKDEAQRGRIIIEQLSDSSWKPQDGAGRRWIVTSPKKQQYDIVGPTRPDVRATLTDFDFTVSAIGYDLQTKELWAHRDFWHDLAGRRLILMPPLILPYGTLSRTIKFARSGYSICHGQLHVLWDQIRAADQDLPEPIYFD